MNVSPVNFCAATKAPTSIKVDKEDEKNPVYSDDAKLIANAINKNTAELNRMGRAIFYSLSCMNDGDYKFYHRDNFYD